MFFRVARTVTRLQRRCAHTKAQSWSWNAQYSLYQVAVAAGASASLASYLTWKLSSERNHIHMDDGKDYQHPAFDKKTPPYSRPAPSVGHPDGGHNIGEQVVDAKDVGFTGSLQSDDTSKKTMSTDTSPTTPSSETQPPSDNASKESTSQDTASENSEAESSEDSEDSASSQAAYNPETGEINWDCPCLGGMAHGPCGQEFRDAFSCFVHSEEEPKGINCVEKFKGMQTCFRAHPDVYGEDALGPDDDDEEETETQTAGAEAVLHAKETADVEQKSASPPPTDSKAPAAS